MWRYLAAGAAILLIGTAVVLAITGRRPPSPAQLLPAVPPAAAQAAPLPDEIPEAEARTREQKRFDRVDKDRNDTITRDEYFALRRKLFARIDTDHDGRLSFDEWSYRAIERFANADADKSSTLTRAEFATTAVKRKPKPKCACGQPAPTPQPSARDDEEAAE